MLRLERHRQFITKHFEALLSSVSSAKAEAQTPNFSFVYQRGMFLAWQEHRWSPHLRCSCWKMKQFRDCPIEFRPWKPIVNVVNGSALGWSNIWQCYRRFIPSIANQPLNCPSNPMKCLPIFYFRIHRSGAQMWQHGRQRERTCVTTVHVLLIVSEHKLNIHTHTHKHTRWYSSYIAV